ncbi:MAG TPA: adenylate/guanylate cyclase domain-containing protein [Leptospiraceae bacterium]|nr:adenylate/guanylate cyclase domain-containing protein [Leptospiraceae bacterium]
MERFIFYGFFSFVLIAVNVFLLISGKNIFPFAVFMFIPLLSIAYGAFRSDFLDLSDLLFKKNLLFYILSVFISLSFLVFAVGVALFLVPGENFQYRNFHFLIPLFSAVVTICLSAYIAGNNPENRLSMFVAMTLFMNGLLNIIMIFRGLYLPILIEHRIGQILFTFIAFNASVQFRLLYIAYNKEVPKISWLIDATAVLTSLFALSPYLYKGYYEFSFGRSGASGPVLLLFSLVNMITLFKILYDWYSFREEKKGSLQAMVMIFAVLGSILSLSAVPSTLGLPIYPLTNLQFIPSLVLAFAILKFHALPIRGETVELTNKISFASTLLVPIILLFYFGGQRIDTSRFQLVLHIVFIGSFLIISIFTFTYILLRPIAKKLDEEKEKILQAQLETETERQKSEKLLLNILPKDVASELKEKGFAEPVLFESVSVMFTDFKGFTTIAENLTPNELVKDLDACFVQFDKISERFNLEKLKTIGDSYMCAGGIPKKNKTHAVDCVLAALEIQDFMNMMKKLKEEKGFPYWELRLGIHSGPLVAGVIGERKFAYDVWGDTVNTASRMESSGTPGKINISGNTYKLVKDFFDCEYRGKVSAKNKGEVEMYYVNRIHPEFSKDEEGRIPNGQFWEMYGR